MWILLTGGLALALAAIAVWWFRRPQRTDLGAVSRQWITEHRLGRAHDRQR